MLSPAELEPYFLHPSGSVRPDLQRLILGTWDYCFNPLLQELYPGEFIYTSAELLQLGPNAAAAFFLNHPFYRDVNLAIHDPKIEGDSANKTQDTVYGEVLEKIPVDQRENGNVF